MYTRKNAFPCRNCKNREVGCHSFCEEYKSSKEKYDEVKEAKNQFNDIDDFIINSIYKKKEKIRRKYGI